MVPAKKIKVYNDIYFYIIYCPAMDLSLALPETRPLPLPAAPRKGAEQPRIGVVIVNYRKAARLLLGVDSLRRQSVAGRLRIIVWDNSCDPGEEDRLRRAGHAGDFELVVSDRNIGYAAGCNGAIALLPPTDYILLMNPDIVWPHPEALEALLRLADATPDCAILAPAQRNDDGSEPEVARSFPTLVEQAWRRLRRIAAPPTALPAGDGNGALRETDWVQSSCCLVRRSLLARIGGLDERFFIFMADVALGHQAWRAGLRVCLAPRISVQADGIRASGGGFRALLTSRVQRIHLRDALVFALENGFRRPVRQPRSIGAEWPR